MSSYVHIDNKNKDILIFSDRPTQGLTAEAKYPINFTKLRKRFVLMLQKIYNFKAKDSEIKYFTLCLGNILKYFTTNNIKKTGSKQRVNFFC